LPLYENSETRKSYARQLNNVKPVFGPATWDQVGCRNSREYLEKRTAKTQGKPGDGGAVDSVELRPQEGLTKLPWPAAGMERSKWKNKETPRTIEVTDALFAAVYSQAPSMLRDAMDLASATGLRVTDCRTVQIPPGDVLRVRASKTGKTAEFFLSESSVLTRLCEARKRISASHLLLLTTPTGKPVSARMLRDEWDRAREKAANAHPELADDLRKMYLRDMRKRASDLAGSLEEASALLQHSSQAVTAKHYRTRATKLKPVR
jgi:hypothetical protein